MNLARRPIGILIATIGIVSSIGSSSCTRSAHDVTHEDPRSVAKFPRAADRFIRLVRRQLTDVDPARTEQEVVCETDRMGIALGYKEAALRVRTALDTAYLTARDSIALGRVQRLLGGQAFGDGDHVCDSLIAAADREDPIIPIDSAKP